MTRLTEPQRRFLWQAKRWTDDDETCGVLARGPGVRLAKALEARGLVEFVAYGVEYDGSDDEGREWPAYAITAAGRALLSATPHKSVEGDSK
jgi:hypothetical protein